jgi:hypothetical protein
VDYKEIIYIKTNIYYTIYQAITGSRITICFLIKIISSFFEGTAKPFNSSCFYLDLMSSFFLKEPRNLISQAIIGSRTTILTIIIIIVKISHSKHLTITGSRETLLKLLPEAVQP